MNKAQIKAELRRSAVEDENPFFDLEDEAWEYLFFNCDAVINSAAIDELRTFYLLMAEAL